MAFVLSGSVLLKPSSSSINGAACSKFSSRQNPYCNWSVKPLLKSRAIRAASSVQQQGDTLAPEKQPAKQENLDFAGVHHVGLLCENLEQSMEFYQGVLGLQLNPDRPADKLPYRGAWFWVGDEMIHLMELPNPDPISGRPEHGGRDRHACLAIRSLDPLKNQLENAGIPFTLSKSGRPALFARDPDGNALEFTQV